jgi:RsiW-degrading membrane proteinase PrsW (M82 family)
VTLGFSLAENIVYLTEAYKSGTSAVFFTGLYRLFFALPLHVFAASVCVIFWWKALSYAIFSWKYIVLFLIGFISAILIHSFYNFLIDKEQIILLILLSSAGYMSFTQWILAIEDKIQSS